MASRLPPEALRVIFQYLGIPSSLQEEQEFGFRRGTYSTFRRSAAASQKDLWRCSLVCKNWTQWAQEALHTDVTLWDQPTYVRFAAALKARPDLVTKVTLLEISCTFSLDCTAAKVKALLHSLPNLRWYRIHVKKRRDTLPEGYQNYLPTAFNAQLTRLTLKVDWQERVELQETDLVGLPKSLERFDLAEDGSQAPPLGQFQSIQRGLSLAALPSLRVVAVNSEVLDRLTITGLSDSLSFQHVILIGPYIGKRGAFQIPLLRDSRKKLKILEYLGWKPFPVVWRNPWECFRRELQLELFGGPPPADLVVILEGVRFTVHEYL